MADVTIGFKGSEEFRSRVSKLIEESGMQNKDWFESLVNLYEFQMQKEISSEYRDDLERIEQHTLRINELVLAIVKRNEDRKLEFLDQISKVEKDKNDLIATLQERVTILKQELIEQKERAEHSIKEKEEMEKGFHQLEKIQETNASLIKEYQEKLDNLTGLIGEYKEAAQENADLRNQLMQSQQRTKEVEQQLQIMKIESENEKRRFDEEKDRMKQESELAIEKGLYNVRSQFSEEISHLHQSYSEKIESLYAKIEQIRMEHESKLGETDLSKPAKKKRNEE